tara:strand:- start:960 stop:1151 length:192 start_codon:yes stop_codon:yes gene_type:complete
MAAEMAAEAWNYGLARLEIAGKPSIMCTWSWWKWLLTSGRKTQAPPLGQLGVALNVGGGAGSS